MASVSAEYTETPWESSKNDHVFKASKQSLLQQQQSSGEAPHEASVAVAAAAKAATSATLNWHEEEEEGRYSNLPVLSSMDIHSFDGSDHRHHHHRHHHRRRNDPQGTNHRPRQICTNCSFHHILHIFDISVLCIVVAYAWNFQNDQNKKRTEQIAILMVSTWIIILMVSRGLLMSFLFPAKRCSRICSAHLTLLLCGTYTVLAFSAWIIMNQQHSNTMPWCHGLGKWCTSLPMALVPTCLTILALTELLRWTFAEVQVDQNQDHHLQPLLHQHEVEEEAVSPSRSNRPWWWNRLYSNSYDDNAMNESFLLRGNTNNIGQPRWTTATDGPSYLMDDGVGTPSSRNYRLGRWLGLVGAGNESNPRDDGSVDYASLNEEWASRSEEDPYWWTRDENNRNYHQHQQQ
jgi:hypothetical protein